MQSNKAGLYTLTVNTPGCGTITSTTLASVTPSLMGAQVLANTPLCAGRSLNLSASIRTNYTYSWTGPNGFTSTLAEPVISNATTLAQGNYTVVFAAPGCGSSNRSISVSVVDPSSVQALNSGPVCVGNAVFFTGRGPAGSTFSWAGPNAFVTNRQNPSLPGVQLIRAGVYTLNVNVPGCGVVSTTTTLVVNNCRENEALQVPTELGLVDAADDNNISKLNPIASDAAMPTNFTILPNPSDGSELNLIWSGLQDTESPLYLSILDFTGKEIYTTLISEGRTVTGDTQYQFRPAVALPKGVYQIRTRCGNLEYNAKWLVQ